LGWNILLKQTKQKDDADIYFILPVVQTIETDSNILDECAAENEWNFSQISKMNRPSHER
jgi:hypothetical protein